MAVITIARQFGAGGRTLGKRLSRQLNYEFFDDSIIQELSKKAKVSKFTIKDIEQTAGSFFSKIVSSALSRSYMERLTGADIGYMDENIYVEKTKEVVTEIAKQEDRIQFMQSFYNYSRNKAYQAVITGQKRRQNLYAKFGKKNYNDPGLYHMVFNMSKLSLDQAMEQIVTLIRQP